MEYKGYIAKVDYDDEAGIFHGEVVNLRDGITFAGESVPELRRAFQESVDDYLAFCAARNEPPEKPYSGKGMDMTATTIDVQEYFTSIPTNPGREPASSHRTKTSKAERSFK